MGDHRLGLDAPLGQDDLDPVLGATRGRTHRSARATARLGRGARRALRPGRLSRSCVDAPDGERPGGSSLHPEEAAHGQARSRRAPTSSPTPIRISAISENDHRAHVGCLVEVDDRVPADTAEQQQDDRRDRAEQPAEQPFEHERPAHEPVRRTDELHHLDLTASGEDRQADRVSDQQRRRDEQNDHGDEEHPPDPRRHLQDPLRRLLAVLDSARAS